MTSFTTAASSRGGPSSRKTSIVQREVVKQRDDIECRMIILTTGRVVLGHSSSSHGEGRGQQQQRRAWWLTEASRPRLVAMSEDRGGGRG